MSVYQRSPSWHHDLWQKKHLKVSTQLQRARWKATRLIDNVHYCLQNMNKNNVLTYTGCWMENLCSFVVQPRPHRPLDFTEENCSSSLYRTGRLGKRTNTHSSSYIVFFLDEIISRTSNNHNSGQRNFCPSNEFKLGKRFHYLCHNLANYISTDLFT